MKISGFALVGIACLGLASASPALSQNRPNESGSAFLCEDGRMLNMRFGTRNAESIALVSNGEARHVLTLMPWDGRTPRVVWSDGQRTLTWDVGVNLHFEDGPSNLACGRRGVRRG